MNSAAIYTNTYAWIACLNYARILSARARAQTKTINIRTRWNDDISIVLVCSLSLRFAHPSRINEHEMLAETENNILHANNPSFKHVRLNEFWAGWVDWVIRMDAGIFSCAFSFVAFSFLLFILFFTFAIEVEKDEKTLKREKNSDENAVNGRNPHFIDVENAKRMNERAPKEK